MISEISPLVLSKAREWRHCIHSHPELAYQEHKTSRLVALALDGMGIPFESDIAGTGIVATLRGNKPGLRAVGLRCELDALPMSETNTFDHVSRHEGVMHACGHDGHTAMLLGAAMHLSQNRDFSGTVRFIFQPAEENEGGAVKMIEEGLFERFPVDSIYALHNWPGLEAGSIAVQPGAMMSSFDFFEFHINGQGGHAGMPHAMKDPIMISSHVISAVQSIVSRNINPFEQAVISITFANGGNNYNIVPNIFKLGGCVRTFDQEIRSFIGNRLKDIANGLSAAFGVTIDLIYNQRFPSTLNTEREALLAQRAAALAVGSSKVLRDFRPSTASEDFSVMLQNKPGAYAWIGNGDFGPNTGLHQPRYDFNDTILEAGVKYYAAIVKEELGALS